MSKDPIISGLFFLSKKVRFILKKGLTHIKLCVIICVEKKEVRQMTSREVIKRLTQDGWVEVDVDGSHHQFRHPTKKGRVTVTHPRKDMPIGTLKSIERQSGLKF